MLLPPNMKALLAVQASLVGLPVCVAVASGRVVFCGPTLEQGQHPDLPALLTSALAALPKGRPEAVGVATAGANSFSNLRIACTTANALAFSLGVPIVELAEADVSLLAAGNMPKNLAPLPRARPRYGAQPNIG